MKPWFSLFLRKMLQIRRNFLATCTTSGTRGAKLQADATFSGRSERPQNRTNAKPCLSDVYKKRTRAKTRQADTIYYRRSAENGADKVLSRGEENSSVHMTYVNFPKPRKSALDVPLYASSSGRSMVEMLGVLAIIGVLSVGAISGYSKAMMKYKLNKSLEQTFYIIHLANEYKDEFKSSHTSSIYYITYFIKMKLIPDDMIKENVSNYVYDKLDHELAVAEIGNGQTRTFGINARNLKNRETEIFYCQSIINYAKEYENITTVRIWGETANYYFHNTDNNKTLQTASLNQIRNACTHVIEEDHLYMHISFR